jgi:hypothetical protein
VTAPANAGSIAFHMSMGFTVTGPVAGYDGTDKDMVVFRREPLARVAGRHTRGKIVLQIGQ